MDTPNSADARIQRWNLWWNIEEPYVCCLRCGASQLIDQAFKPFNSHHTMSCTLRSDLPQYPWRELSQLLKMWQLELEP